MRWASSSRWSALRADAASTRSALRAATAAIPSEHGLGARASSVVRLCLVVAAGEPDDAGVVVVLEGLAVASPGDDRPKHPLGLVGIELFVEQAQERPLGKPSRGLLLETVADVRSQRNVHEQLLAE